MGKSVSNVVRLPSSNHSLDLNLAELRQEASKIQAMLAEVNKKIKIAEFASDPDAYEARLKNESHTVESKSLSLIKSTSTFYILS